MAPLRPSVSISAKCGCQPRSLLWSSNPRIIAGAQSCWPGIEGHSSCPPLQLSSHRRQKGPRQGQGQSHEDTGGEAGTWRPPLCCRMLSDCTGIRQVAWVPALNPVPQDHRNWCVHVSSGTKCPDARGSPGRHARIPHPSPGVAGEPTGQQQPHNTEYPEDTDQLPRQGRSPGVPVSHGSESSFLKKGTEPEGTRYP